MLDFSMENYVKILQKYRDDFCDFGDVHKRRRRPAVYLRHDVEADLDKACYLAEINYDQGVSGLFTLQVVSELYSVSSTAARAALKKLIGCEQQLGLHYYSDYRESEDFAFQDFHYQASLLNTTLGSIGERPFKAFSYHRPTTIQLTKSQKREAPMSYIDCYGPDYFEYTSEPTSVSIKYVSDSDHEWRYGHPLTIYPEMSRAIQILMHPEEWPADTAQDVYHQIEKTKAQLLKNALDKEYKKYTL